MKKILFISTLESTPWGGSEQLWSDIAVRLLDEGHKVMACTIAWPETPLKINDIKTKGGQTVSRPNPHISQGITTRIANKLNADKWKDEIAAFKPDVIFINQGGTFDNALHLMGDWIRSLNIPFYILSNFCPEYGYLPEGLRNYFRPLFAAAREVFFVSRRNKEVAERMLLSHIDNGKIIINPIRLKDTPKGYPDAAIYKVAAVARLEADVKGYDVLFESLSQPQWKDRNIQVNIYGTGEHESYLKELAVFKGISDKIIFKGFHNNVVDIWEENHLLVMPSRGEGTPLSLLEACFCGRAAVVTDVGGNADVITEGLNGFVAEAPVVGCFSAAMERAWQSREKWQQLGQAAKEKITKTHSADAVDMMIQKILRAGMD